MVGDFKSGSVFLMIMIFCAGIIFSSNYSKNCSELKRWETAVEQYKKQLAETNYTARYQSSGSGEKIQEEKQNK